MVANFWLRPGDVSSANNVVQFIESTLHHLGRKALGLLRADSSFYDQAVFKLLEDKGDQLHHQRKADPTLAASHH